MTWQGMLALSAVVWIAIGSLVAYGLTSGPSSHYVRFGVLPLWVRNLPSQHQGHAMADLCRC
jgi:hypothetical protein